MTPIARPFIVRPLSVFVLWLTVHLSGCAHDVPPSCPESPGFACASIHTIDAWVTHTSSTAVTSGARA